MSLGKKLSGYRRDAGYTQQQLGDLLNVSAQAVSKWENDQAEPDLQMLRRLCLIYKIKMDDLFDEEGAAAEEEKETPPSEETTPAETEKPKILGYCVSCGSVVYKGNEVRTPSGLYCKICYGERVKRANKTTARAGQTKSNDRPKVDNPSFGYGLLGFLFPVVGLVLYFVWKEEYPNRAASCLTGFFIEIAFAIISVILLFAITGCSVMQLL